MQTSPIPARGARASGRRTSPTSPRRKKTITERALTPLSLRFREEDLDAIRAAAAKNDEGMTIFVRNAILLRVERLDAQLAVPALRFEADGKLGQPMSVRFRPADFKRVARWAANDDRTATAWARAVAVEFALRKRAA
jgi:hypothetical protein